MPGIVVRWSTVSAWAGALRAIGGREPSDRGFLTRSDGGPRRAEGWQTLRTARAISARACGALSFGPEGLPPSGPDRPKPLLRTPTFRRPTHPAPSNTGRRTLPARPPPPPVRSPAGRPPQRWGSSDYAGGLEGGDKFGSRNFRALKSWGFGGYPPRIDVLSNPLPEGYGIHTSRSETKS